MRKPFSAWHSLCFVCPVVAHQDVRQQLAEDAQSFPDDATFPKKAKTLLALSIGA